MSASSRLKVKQDDLRRLMRERRENVGAKKQKIDSPLAKYNEFGKLYCISCNVQIKNEALWANHITGKIHKEHIQRKKKSHVFLKPSIVNSGENIKTDGLSNEKKNSRVEQSSNHKGETERSSSTLNTLHQYSSSDEEESVLVESPSKNLPNDFFDASTTSSDTASVTNNSSTPSEQKNEIGDALCGSAQSLPEGFFDNPVLDAKVRNIEYKDPIEEEWERFQKTIQEETNFSKTIMEEDVAESTVERNIEQIDQQIHHWGTVKFLQSKFEEECLKNTVKPEEKDVSDSNDEDELDDLLDWRSKGVRT